MTRTQWICKENSLAYDVARGHTGRTKTGHTKSSGTKADTEDTEVTAQLTRDCKMQLARDHKDAKSSFENWKTNKSTLWKSFAKNLLKFSV